MKEVIFIDGNRSGYSPEDCGYTITVGELIRALEQYNEETPVYLRNDNGYTYGHIREWGIYSRNIKENGEEAEEDFD